MFSAIFFLMTLLKANLAEKLVILALTLVTVLAIRVVALGATLDRVRLPVIKVGFINGPDREILERVKSISLRRGQELELVFFPSSQESLKALAQGQIDISASQHQPTLEEFVLENNLKLISLGNTYVAPLAFYSQKIKSINDLESGARLVISEEPDKRRRALRLLAQNGLLKLNDQEWPSVKDITDNPIKLEIIEAIFFKPYLNSDSISAIAFSALSEEIISQTAGWPKLRSICQEEANSPYVYVLAAKKSRAQRPSYLEFVRDYQSQEIAKFLLRRFEGSIIPVYDFE
jgi:D-methionine transport system substrate-binding protein